MGAGFKPQQGTGREASRRSVVAVPSLLALYLPPPPAPCQELSKREVVPVRHLEVPAEVAGLLQAAAGASSLTAAGKGWGEGCNHHMLPPPAGLKPSSVPRVAIVRTPRLQTEPCVTLPLDINNYPMAKFIRCHFKVRAGPSSLAPGH